MLGAKTDEDCPAPGGIKVSITAPDNGTLIQNVSDDMVHSNSALLMPQPAREAILRNQIKSRMPPRIPASVAPSDPDSKSCSDVVRKSCQNERASGSECDGGRLTADEVMKTGDRKSLGEQAPAARNIPAVTGKQLPNNDENGCQETGGADTCPPAGQGRLSPDDDVTATSQPVDVTCLSESAMTSAKTNDSRREGELSSQAISPCSTYDTEEEAELLVTSESSRDSLASKTSTSTHASTGDFRQDEHAYCAVSNEAEGGDDRENRISVVNNDRMKTTVQSSPQGKGNCEAIGKSGRDPGQVKGDFRVNSREKQRKSDTRQRKGKSPVAKPQTKQKREFVGQTAARQASGEDMTPDGRTKEPASRSDQLPEIANADTGTRATRKMRHTLQVQNTYSLRVDASEKVNLPLIGQGKKDKRPMDGDAVCAQQLGAVSIRVIDGANRQARIFPHGDAYGRSRIQCKASIRNGKLSVTVRSPDSVLPSIVTGWSYEACLNDEESGRKSGKCSFPVNVTVIRERTCQNSVPQRRGVATSSRDVIGRSRLKPITRDTSDHRTRSYRDIVRGRPPFVIGSVPVAPEVPVWKSMNPKRSGKALDRMRYPGRKLPPRSERKGKREY